jgi:hypothetical protein
VVIAVVVVVVVVAAAAVAVSLAGLSFVSHECISSCHCSISDIRHICRVRFVQHVRGMLYSTVCLYAAQGGTCLSRGA